MPVKDVQKDLEAMTMTVIAEFDADPERVWEVWADPRQLERWWGPPQYPATFTDHDLSPGGRAAYYMTGPDGTRHHGWWKVEEVEPPQRLRFEDGFGDDDGNPNPELPTSVATVTISGGEGRTTMTIESRYQSREALEQVLEMGVEQGLREALGQIDALLRDRQ